MNESKEFPEDSRIKVIFRPYGRIALSYRKGEWNNEEAEVVQIDQNNLKDYFSSLKLDSMYGWEFINLHEQDFNKWSDKLSLDKRIENDWRSMNTIDLFAEQNGEDPVTIDVRIWFDDLEIFDYDSHPMTIQQFIDSGQRGWDQLYNTGVESKEHKNYKMKK